MSDPRMSSDWCEPERLIDKLADWNLAVQAIRSSRQGLDLIRTGVTYFIGANSDEQVRKRRKDG